MLATTNQVYAAAQNGVGGSTVGGVDRKAPVSFTQQLCEGVFLFVGGGGEAFEGTHERRRRGEPRLIEALKLGWRGPKAKFFLYLVEEPA